MSTTVISPSPFSDRYATSASLFDDRKKSITFCDVRFDPSGHCATSNNEQYDQSASVPNKVAVPILDTVSACSSDSSQSSQSSVSIASTPPSSNPSGDFDGSIKWTDADLSTALYLTPESTLT
jgi:hypothetical protein